MRVLSAALLVMVLPASGAADGFSINFSLSIDEIETSLYRGMDHIHLPGGVASTPEGFPALPGRAFTFVVPPGASLESVDLEVLGMDRLPGRYRLHPVEVRTTGPGLEAAPDIYAPVIPDPFPEDPVVGVHQGSMSGFRLVSVVLVPFVYHPGSGEVLVITSARLSLELEEDGRFPAGNLTRQQTGIARSALEGLVVNPEDLPGCSPPERSGTGDWPSWVVVADSSYESVLEPLVEWRAQTAGSAGFMPLDSIYSSYEGWDTQEQIRNFLKDAFENHGLVYALIVGDFGETTRVSHLTVGSMTLNETADLYYSDLDGTWDGDGDHRYGENTDNIDYYSDIYVGRFSSDVSSRIESMVERTILYEQGAPPGGWRETVLLAGAGLWPESGYWGSFVCDSIALRVPGGWTIHKLYEDSLGHPDNQIELINEGVSYVGPQGHGNPGGVYWYRSPPYLITTQNYDEMTNWGMFPVFHSMACSPGALSDPACIAERLMFWPDGGAIAVMFNSAAGIGTPPELGPSELLELHFAEQLFRLEQPEIGVAQALAKDAFYAGPGIVFKHWVLQTNNLLGDPATRFAPWQTGVEGEGGVESGGGSVLLSPPVPNPAGSVFSVEWSLPPGSSGVIQLFDMSGRLVGCRDLESSGSSGSVALHAVDDVGRALPSGCYQVRLWAREGTASRRLLVLR